jgi:hypothetical protein
MKKLTFFLVSFALLLTSCSLQKEEVRKTVNSNLFLPTIEKQLEAFNDEDVDKYMTTAHSSLENTDTIKQNVEKAFADYDVEAKIDSWEVVSGDGDEIVVRIVQSNRKLDSSDFKDNKTTALHTMKLDGGVYKFWNTTIEKTEYID